MLPPGSELAGARGDTILPYSVEVIFQQLVKDASTYRKDIDAQLDKVFILEELSPQHCIEVRKVLIDLAHVLLMACVSSYTLQRTAYKGVFPTDPRDFVVFSGWEATPEGGFMVYTVSVTREDAPVVKGYVRGTLDIGGWVILPISSADDLVAARTAGLGPKDATFSNHRQACRVSRLFRMSIGGGVPIALVRSGMLAQCQVPLVLHKLLRKRISKDGAIPEAAVCNISLEPSVLPPSSDAGSEGDSPPQPSPLVHPSLPVIVGPAIDADPKISPSHTGMEALEPNDVGSSAVDAATAFAPLPPAPETSEIANSEFIPPPLLNAPYESLRIDTAAKMRQLYDDVFSPGGSSAWKLTGHSK